MEPGKLEELSRLGGKVVEIRLTDSRHAIGFLVTANNDKIVLHPIDRDDQGNSVTYRTSRCRDFVRFDTAELIQYDHEIPAVGSRLMVTLVNQAHVCGYKMPSQNGVLTLSREVMTGGRNCRPHCHRPEHIKNMRELRPASDQS